MKDNETPTPETDALWDKFDWPDWTPDDSTCQMTGHARRLERERDEARRVARQMLDQNPASFLMPDLKLPWDQ